MAGNVWEWVRDRYAADYYATSPPTDPPGPADGLSRVIRGLACTVPVESEVSTQPVLSSARFSSAGMPPTDRLLALAFAGLAVLTRVPFRARLLPTWDAIQFALALREYDVAKHQPHPPGYILYVGLGRAVAVVLRNRDDAFVWIAIAASAVTILALYRLAWVLYGRATAVVATGGLLASPLFWFEGLVGLPYAVEGALATIVTALVWPMLIGSQAAARWSAVALGLAGGVRQSLLLLLFPLWLGAAWRGLGRARPVVVSLAALGLTALAWLGPMLWLAGGPARYVAASRELYESTVRATTLADSRAGWLGNVRGLLQATLMGLGLFLPVSIGVLIEAWRRRRQWGPRAWLFAAWLGPPLTVYTAVHFGQYGYLLTVLPALYLLVARHLVEAAGRQRWRLGIGVTIVLLLHAAIFLGARPVDVPEPGDDAPPLAAWSARLYAVLWAHTADGLREHQLVLRTYVDAIRQDFDPGDTVLVTELGNPRSYPWFRHATYYLPEFTTVHLRLDGFTPGYLISSCLDSMAAHVGPDVPLPPGTRRLVWMVDSWNPAVAQPAGLEARALAYGRWLYRLSVDERGIEYGGYRLAPQARQGCRPAPVTGRAPSGRAGDANQGGSGTS